MQSQVRESNGATATLVVGVAFLALGVLQIHAGITQYDPWEIVGGAVMLTFSPWQIYRWLVLTKRLGKRPRLDWSFLVVGILMLLVLGRADIADVSNSRFAFWTGTDSRVTPMELVRHPYLYNNQPVHTSGYVLAGGGDCTLELDGAAVRADEADASLAYGIWVSAAGKLCRMHDTQRIHASVSGVYLVYDGKPERSVYRVLSHADITPTGDVDARH